MGVAEVDYEDMQALAEGVILVMPTMDVGRWSDEDWEIILDRFAANKEVNNVIVLPFRVSVVHLKEEVIKE